MQKNWCQYNTYIIGITISVASPHPQYEWKYHDGDILGEDWLADEYHGIDTCDIIDVEGVGISLPAKHTSDVVLEPVLDST